MIDWLSDVFTSNSDKARVVAIVISAVIAITVLLLNQGFTTRRTRKDILIKKIEEVYLSSLAYEKHARKLLKGIQKGERDHNGNFYIDPSLIELMNEEVDKIVMIVGLYFPKEHFNKDKYYAGSTLPILEIAIKEKRLPENELIDAAERTRGNIKINVSEINALCVELMNKHRH